MQYYDVEALRKNLYEYRLSVPQMVDEYVKIWNLTADSLETEESGLARLAYLEQSSYLLDASSLLTDYMCACMAFTYGYELMKDGKFGRFKRTEYKVPAEKIMVKEGETQPL